MPPTAQLSTAERSTTTPPAARRSVRTDRQYYLELWGNETAVAERDRLVDLRRRSAYVAFVAGLVLAAQLVLGQAGGSPGPAAVTQVGPAGQASVDDGDGDDRNPAQRSSSAVGVFQRAPGGG